MQANPTVPAQNEQRANITHTLFVVRRMDLVPTVCMVMVAEFILIFVAIVVIQFSKDEMSLG